MFSYRRDGCRALASALAAVTLLAACSPAAPANPGAATDAGTAALAGPRGTLKIAWSDEPDTLGPKFITGGGGNYIWLFNSFLTGSFADADVDRLQNLVLTSLDPAERREATIALHRRLSEVVGIGALYYQVEVILATNNVKGLVGNYGPQQGVSWNAFEWEVVP